MKTIQHSMLWSPATFITSFMLTLPMAHAQVGPTPMVPAGGSPPGAYPNKTVTAANWTAAGDPAGDTGDVHLGLDGQGPVAWSMVRYNRGDFAVRLSPLDPVDAQTNLNLGFTQFGNADSTAAPGQVWGPHRDKGVLIPVVRQNGPIDWGDGTGPFYPTIATGYASSGNRYDMVDGTYGAFNATDVNTGKAGPVGEGNFNFGTVWFPYEQGWVGGFVANPAGDGTPAWDSANSHSPCLTTNVIFWPDQGGGTFGGTAEISLPGANSPTNGMLFTTSTQGDSTLNITASAPKGDGSGWVVSIREDSEANPAVLAIGQSQFGFVFVPYSAANLIGGHINGSDGSSIESRGSFTLTRTGTGTFELTIPGKTGTNGVLLLQNASFLGISDTVADNNFLSYEYNNGSGKFIIQARSTDGTTANAPEADVNFYFAWVDFEKPLVWAPKPVVPVVPDGGSPPGAYPNKSVTAAVWNAQGSPTGDTGDVILSLPGQGPIPWSMPRYNRGDFAVRLSPLDPVAAQNNLNLGFTQVGNANANEAPGQAWRPNRDKGVIIPTCAQNGPIDWGDGGGDFYPTIATGLASSGNGYDMLDGSFGAFNAVDINTGKAGSVGEGNFRFATTWFPYDECWIGGYVANPAVDGSAQWESPNAHTPGLTTGVISWPDQGGGSFGGNAVISLPGVNSLSDGMLFTTSYQGDSTLNISASAPKADGSGWVVTIREDSEANPAILAANNQSQFAFVYVPYSTTGLIGGHINGTDGSSIQSRGTFTLTRTGVGTYELTLPGETGTTGVLLLQNASFLGLSDTTADNNFMSYEYNAGSGKFIIQARNTDGSTANAPLADVNFYFAWVDFAKPLGSTALNPRLTIVRSGADVVISWPTESTGFFLECATSLTPPIDWTPILKDPEVNGNSFEVTESASVPAKFYRLRCP